MRSFHYSNGKVRASEGTGSPNKLTACSNAWFKTIGGRCSGINDGPVGRLGPSGLVLHVLEAGAGH